MARDAAPQSQATFGDVVLASSKSRAEVLAELQIYQRSGLADLERRDSPDWLSQQYQAASARYAALRSSPEFASLVKKIEQRRVEMAHVAASSTSL